MINRHTVKLSYSVTDNFENIIQKYNSKMLCEEKEQRTRNRTAEGLTTTLRTSLEPLDVRD